MKKKRVVKKRAEKVEESCRGRVFCWVPRALVILYIVFLSLFAFDALERGGIVSFLIQMIPSALLVVVLAVAWKCEKMGGGLFLVLGVIFTVFFATYREVMTFSFISLPLFLAGVLFLVNAKNQS